jgi:hypothetical protein|tara:strand:- start:781 stop:966 length:186 start_codon:yes stop_codon:yes gene_type:complete
MTFKIVEIKKGKRREFKLNAIEILEIYGTEIRICDLHKAKAPIRISENSDTVVKIYGYEAS